VFVIGNRDSIIIIFFFCFLVFYETIVNRAGKEEVLLNSTSSCVDREDQ
jgi:hypothetical protein